MSVKRFKALAAHHRALVSLAVLLDGHEAAMYLKNDVSNGEILQKAALDIAAQQPNVRMPFLGTALRDALTEMENS